MCVCTAVLSSRMRCVCGTEIAYGAGISCLCGTQITLDVRVRSGDNVRWRGRCTDLSTLDLRDAQISAGPDTLRACGTDASYAPTRLNRMLLRAYCVCYYARESYAATRVQVKAGPKSQLRLLCHTPKSNTRRRIPGTNCTATVCNCV
eukprot:1170018-Rhodomonas_salina.1